jgi:hypothetical protein
MHFASNPQIVLYVKLNGRRTPANPNVPPGMVDVPAPAPLCPEGTTQTENSTVASPAMHTTLLKGKKKLGTEITI